MYCTIYVLHRPGLPSVGGFHLFGGSVRPHSLDLLSAGVAGQPARMGERPADEATVGSLHKTLAGLSNALSTAIQATRDR